MKTQKRISGRALRRGTPEENLTPGESLLVHKQSGKIFELRRLDSGEQSLVRQLDHLFLELPNPGELARTNLARTLVEDRE